MLPPYYPVSPFSPDLLMQTSVRNLSMQRSFMAHQRWSTAQAVANSNTAVLGAQAGTAQNITTGLVNPPCPRNITATAGGTAGDIKAIQVTVEGTDYDDQPISETLPAFTVDTAGTVSGSKAFKTVTRVIIPAHDGAAATTSIGFGSRLGLPYKLAHNTVQDAFRNNVREGTAPTVTTSEVDLSSNTITLNSALNGTVVDAYYLT